MRGQWEYGSRVSCQLGPAPYDWHTEMGKSRRPNESPGCNPQNPRDHQRSMRVAGDIEGHPKEDMPASADTTGSSTLPICHIETGTTRDKAERHLSYQRRVHAETIRRRESRINTRTRATAARARRLTIGAGQERHW